jgi:hypothetical protein
MPDRPPAIKRLDSLLSAAMIAHEAIFEMHRELISADRANPERARLLEESARIVTVELSGLSAKARQLSTEWSEQSVLDPEGAAGTLEELEVELIRVEPQFLSASTAASNRHEAALDAGVVELRRGEPGRGSLLVSIRQRESRIAIAIDVGLRRMRTKLLSTRGELPRRLLGLLQQFLHQLDRPALLVGNVWPRMGGHAPTVAPVEPAQPEPVPPSTGTG